MAELSRRWCVCRVSCAARAQLTLQLGAQTTPAQSGNFSLADRRRWPALFWQPFLHTVQWWPRGGQRDNNEVLSASITAAVPHWVHAGAQSKDNLYLSKDICRPFGTRICRLPNLTVASLKQSWLLRRGFLLNFL